MTLVPRGLSLALAAAVLLTLVPKLTGPAVAAEREIDQVGYFKSADRQRVFSFASDALLTRDEAAAALDDVMNTPGRVTVAVIYPPGAQVPADALTLAATMGDAIALISGPPFDRWAWQLWINPRGERKLIDRSGE